MSPAKSVPTTAGDNGILEGRGIRLVIRNAFEVGYIGFKCVINTMMENIADILRLDFAHPLPLDPLPELQARSPNVPHAPKRNPNLTPDEEKLAIKNALRYFPQTLHQKLGQEFYQ